MKKFKEKFSVIGPEAYKPVSDEGCPHWRQVAGQYDLMHHYKENAWKAVGYFQSKAMAERVAEALNKL